LTARLRGLADSRRPGSLADRLRQRRFELLRGLLDALGRPVRILDVGGTTGFWERVGYAGRDGVEIVLLNQIDQEAPHDNLTAVLGDAADLSAFGDGSFDVVLSNSVIEHLPTPELQGRMAAEMRRVGRCLYVQTPNRYFPLEPHFLFPFFALLPLNVRAFLLQHLDLGWHLRQPNRAAALREVRSIRLMTGRELRRAFPGATIERERILVFTKSFIVLDGWDPQEG
jgi:SAM-dependent methyltransferase